MKPIPRTGSTARVDIEARKPNSKSKRLQSSIAIENEGSTILVDCTENFDEQKKLLKQVNAVLLTHAHSDAIGGLKKLDSWLNAKIPVFAAKHTIAKIKGKFSNLEFKEIKPLQKFELFGLKIIPLPVKHSVQPGFDPTFAYYFSDSFTFVYAEDVESIPKESWKYFKGVDLLFLDAASYKKKMFGHLTMQQSILVGLKAGAKNLYLAQIGHSYPPHEEIEKEARKLLRELDPSSDMRVGVLFDGMKISDSDLDEELQGLEGIYLTDEHAKMIWNGNKSLIVKAKYYPDAVDKEYYLIGSNRSYGIIRINKVYKIGLDDFNKLRLQHRISESDRKKFFGNKKSLYAYEFSVVQRFVLPKTVRVPMGTEVFIRDVHFLFEHDLIRNIVEYDPSKQPTPVLRDDMRIAMAWYSSKKEGKHVPYSFEEIENVLQLIIEELVRRGNTEFHPEKMKPNSREIFEKIWKKINKQEKVPQRKLAQVPDFVSYVRDAILIKDAVCLVGSSVEKKKHHDIDVLIRISQPTDFLKRAIETRLYKMFPEKIGEQLHFIWGDAEGPHDSYVPLFDLCLIAQKPKLIEMNETTLLKPFKPMKPEKRFYRPEKAIEFAFSKAPIWACEKKFNGFRAVIHKKGNDVKIFSDQGKDITFPFPTVERQAMAASEEDFIIDCELVPYLGRKPLGRSEAAKYIGSVKSHKDINDSQVVFHAFDCLYYGKDITDSPWFERKNYLKKLRFSNNLKMVASIIVDSKDEMYKAIRMFSNMVGSEGCMLKKYDGKYFAGKETNEWIKYRTLLPLRVTVLEVNEVKGGSKARNYTVGIKLSKAEAEKINQKYVQEVNKVKYLKLGNTFNTSLVAHKFNVLDLLVEEVWRHRHKDGTIHYSLHKPNVKGISKQKTDSRLSELDEYVVARGVEVEAWQCQDTGSAVVGGSPIDASALQPVKIKKKKKEELSEGKEIGLQPKNFPDRMQECFRSVKDWKPFVMQWHYRGHEISEDERKRLNIPSKYKWKLDSLHTDSRYAVNDHLEGITMLSPTTTDPSIPDKIGPNMKHVRAVLKAPQPKQWLNVEGISMPGEPGTTRKAPAVFVIVGKGEYKPVVVEDHRLIFELKSDSGKINEKVFKDAENKGILIGRKPGSELKKLPKFIEYHIAHIGDKHIILVDGRDSLG